MRAHGNSNASGGVVAGAGRHEPAIGISAQLEDRYPPQRTAFPDGVLRLAGLFFASIAGLRLLLASIAARGCVVASVYYWIGSEALSPVAERNIKSVIAWLRANAA